MASTKLPDCGLYRTTKALPGHEEKVPAGILVNFHNHSESGLPQVRPPADHNVHNRWHWAAPILIRGTSWLETLVRMPYEGFYVLQRDVPAENGEGRITKGTLVQLGYQNTGKPILFIAREATPLQENVLFFKREGMMINRSQLGALMAVKWHKEHPPEGGEAGGTPHVH